MAGVVGSASRVGRGQVPAENVMQARLMQRLSDPCHAAHAWAAPHRCGGRSGREPLKGTTGRALSLTGAADVVQVQHVHPAAVVGAVLRLIMQCRTGTQSISAGVRNEPRRPPPAYQHVGAGVGLEAMEGVGVMEARKHAAEQVRVRQDRPVLKARGAAPAAARCTCAHGGARSPLGLGQLQEEQRRLVHAARQRGAADDSRLDGPPERGQQQAAAHCRKRGQDVCEWAGAGWVGVGVGGGGEAARGHAAQNPDAFSSMFLPA